MSSKEIVIIYKEVGKDAEFKKVQNEQNTFENLIGGELDYIPYEDITILARKKQDNLRPNIYINTEFLSLGPSIRGNIIIVCRENETFKSLTKKQAIKYREFLKRASLNYDNFDEKGRYIPNIKNSQFKNRGQLIIEKGIGENDVVSPKTNNEQCFNTDETLKMILGIQSMILKFIKNSTD